MSAFQNCTVDLWRALNAARWVVARPPLFVHAFHVDSIGEVVDVPRRREMRVDAVFDDAVCDRQCDGTRIVLAVSAYAPTYWMPPPVIGNGRTGRWIDTAAGPLRREASGDDRRLMP